MSGQAQEGWYPDPGGTDALRWWDGAGWTEHLHDPGSAGAQRVATAPQQAPERVEQIEQAPASGTAPTPEPMQPAALSDLGRPREASPPPTPAADPVGRPANPAPTPAPAQAVPVAVQQADSAYSALVRQRLEQQEFTIDPPAADGLLRAIHKKFEAGKMGLATTFVVVADRRPACDAAHARELANYALAAALNRTPGVRGLGSMLIAYTVIVVDSVNPELEGFATAKAPKKWAAFHVPVVVELSSGRVIYNTDKQAWGAAYLKSIRSRADQLFTPA